MDQFYSKAAGTTIDLDQAVTAAKKGEKLPGANGVMRVRSNMWGLWQTLEFHGGPYLKKPKHREIFGVCLREEEPDDFHVWMPIVDFSVPKPSEERDVIALMQEAIAASFRGRLVWIGCTGGMGRTGLVMALIAKALGVKDPVAFVRKTYYAHAVETAQQKAYVEAFPTHKLRWWLLQQAWRDMRGCN